ncbi:alpha/beta hydrolase family protein [Fimbriiglobus ruber]|uniref:Peptidase S9 prolyl oligopeptidase catalytic domain-containing protein n=1 Tax=Fimbriiglobus ruber TaxID=1908690 RepID=A0A225DNS3_9BACT|nr:prolyl oligopeptidase family serine peptidase [Fimbriiglobus ruber]OWK43110.1 hypothetical protein FRUB_02709 [Fimbriiglobus ruber]
MRIFLVAATLLSSASLSFAQPAAPPKANRYPRGEAMSEAYFRNQVKQIEDTCLTDLTTKDAWEKKRPELRRQFLDMMGLWPLPPRTDLKAVVTGKVEGAGFTVKKVQFQSRPGLYVTGNLYLPASSSTKSGKIPAILYVCGHGNVVENGVSYGSKVFYQYHPAWFAAHGYACLILDTLELAELPGDHHGTYRRGWWWWQTRGYTPGGVELWNAMRAIDYLETRPEVDATRIGVTGRSGGGATSWWILAADERPRAFVPVAGIADLRAHLNEAPSPKFPTGVIGGHCDCMYMVNTYRWDFPLVAALAAPRPLLLGNSDLDDIFPVGGYRRIADKVRRVYALYGAEEKFQLLETKGPHKDTPELRAGINQWMNRWLKNDTSTKVEDDLPPKFAPPQLKVFTRLPEDAVNATIHETFVPAAATLEIPKSDAVAKEWWAHRRPQLLDALTTSAFAGWPKAAPALTAKNAADVTHDGVRLRAIDFTSETGIDLRLFVLTAPGADAPVKVILSVLDDRGWEMWCRDLGPEFADALQLDAKPKRDAAKFEQNRAVMRAEKLAFAAVAPRGIGPTKWADAGSQADTLARRRFALVGQTLDGQRVWDVRRAVTALRTATDLRTTPLTLHGERDAAGVALYAALYEPGVAALDLWELPTSHRDGPIFLNVAKVLDVPQAVALVAPRPVTIHTKLKSDNATWAWPLRLQSATGNSSLQVRAEGE